MPAGGSTTMATTSKILARDRAMAYLAIQEEIRNRVKKSDPTVFGLPDLLRLDPDIDGRDKDDPTLIADQVEAIRVFARDHVKHIVKDKKRRPIYLIGEQARFVADLFYRRVQKAIVWKSRGGGGSFAAALLVWLMLTYRNMSWIDMAGSQEQSKAVYIYTKQFWRRFPKVADAFLAEPPLAAETRLKGGILLKCVPTSEKAVRSKHVPGLLLDEACQEREDAEKIMKAAVNGAMSEPDHVVVLLSTFHYPTGIFAETWDNAKELGYARYNWNIFETMAKCEADVDCRTGCPLTWKEKLNQTDGTVQEVYKGCDGKARESVGWLGRNQVLDIQQTNRGSEMFEVEYANQRPRFKAQVYDPDRIEDSLVRQIPYIPPPSGIVTSKILGPDGKPLASEIEDDVVLAAGIDWGIATMMAMVLVAYMKGMLWVVDVRCYAGVLEEVAAETLREWRGLYGRPFVTHPDGSHPFSNARLSQEFNIVPVFFSQMKDWGIRNVNQWLNTGRLKIPVEFVALTGQMRKLRRNAQGRVIKRDDHTPDALMCAVRSFPYEQYHGGTREDAGDVSVTMFGPGGEPTTLESIRARQSGGVQ